MDGCPVQFKINTGADFTVVPESAVKGTRLVKSDRPLFGPGRTRICVIGMMTVTLVTKRQSVREEVHVVQELYTALLGNPAIDKLNIVI